jgi:hypothetical protein
MIEKLMKMMPIMSEDPSFSKMEDEVKLFVEQNLDQIEKDILHYEATQEVNETLKKATDILVGLSPFYAVVEVYTLVSEIKSERYFKEMFKNV